MGVLRVAFLSALVLEMVATISTAVVAVQIGLRLLYGHLAFEEALLCPAPGPRVLPAAAMLGTRFHAGMAGVAAAQRIFEVLDTAPTSVLRPRAKRPRRVCRAPCAFSRHRQSPSPRFHLCFDVSTMPMTRGSARP